MEQSIPVVDLSHYGDPDRGDAFVKAIGDSLKELGFVAIVNHGIDQELFDATYDAYRAFFACDDATKRKAERPSTGRRRGYTSFGVEHAKDSDKPDLKELPPPQNLWVPPGSGSFPSV